MATTDPQVLQEALTQIARGHTGRVLVFEPDTGEILVLHPGEKPSPDAIRAGQTAEEGYWVWPYAT